MVKVVAKYPFMSAPVCELGPRDSRLSENLISTLPTVQHAKNDIGNPISMYVMLKVRLLGSIFKEQGEYYNNKAIDKTRQTAQKRKDINPYKIK